MVKKSSPSPGDRNAKPAKSSGKTQSERVKEASAASTWFLRPAGMAADAAAYAGKQIAKSLGTVGTEVFDLNGDGLIDQKDVQLLARKVQKAADNVLRSEPIESAIKAAAVGSVVAIPIPLIGPAGGAATAVIFYFAYRGTKGIVQVASAPFKKRSVGKTRSKKKKTSLRRVRTVATKN